MKNVKLFFYRVDLIREGYFWISVPMMLACWFLPVGFNMFYLLPISLIGLLWKLFPMPIPSNTQIERELADFYTEHQAQLLRKIEGVKAEDVLQVKGFSDCKANLRRSVGTRTLFPVCRSLLFIEKDGGLCVYGRDLSLADNVKNDFVLSCTKEEKMELLLTDNADFSVLQLNSGKTEIMLYAKGRHFIDKVVECYKAYVTVNGNSRD